MNHSINLIALLLLLSSFASNPIQNKCKSPDLKAIKIEEPDWDHDNQRTIVKVQIKNAGEKTSQPCRALLYDLDISLDQAKAMKLDKFHKELIAENNGRASYFTGDAAQYVDENQFDYDRDFAVFVSIPELKPGKKVTLTFYIKDIWIYDSNCEIRLVADVDETNQDCDRSNNVMDFFAWG